MDRRQFGKLVLGTAAAGSVPGAIGCEPPDARLRGVPSRGAPGRGQRVRAVARVTPTTRTFEGAGFPVRRPFPTGALALMDPFVLLDEMGPVNWEPGAARGAPDHPHRGFETVTYVLQGAAQHRDSLGNRGRLGPGDVQWMTAGAGIVHSEMPADEIVQQGGELHAFQLWVNLPARAKWVPPAYQNLGHADIPTGGTDDGRVRANVIAGEALGVRATVATHTPMVYQHWTLQPGGAIDQRIAADHNVCALVFRGECQLGEDRRTVREGELAIFGSGDVVRMGVAAGIGARSTELLLLAGVPLGEPVARRGPFVMNTDDEVRQAFEDYRSGRMGSIPG